jgi:hypothetical protein
VRDLEGRGLNRDIGCKRGALGLATLLAMTDLDGLDLALNGELYAAAQAATGVQDVILGSCLTFDMSGTQRWHRS